jgi:hypothetical protein
MTHLARARAAVRHLRAVVERLEGGHDVQWSLTVLERRISELVEDVHAMAMAASLREKGQTHEASELVRLRGATRNSGWRQRARRARREESDYRARAVERAGR